MGDNGRADSRAWVLAALEAYEAPLMRYAARLTGDVERARDVVQDTFIRLCAQPQAVLEGREREWLFTVCRNRALDVRRKEQRMTPMAAEVECRECSAPSPPAALERDEESGQVLRLVEALPENQQEVIRLKFEAGLSYREIAGVTGLSVSNVGFLIHTGLKALREKMRNAEFGMRNA